jgi:hypothetical protein
MISLPSINPSKEKNSKNNFIVKQSSGSFISAGVGEAAGRSLWSVTVAMTVSGKEQGEADAKRMQIRTFA